jgi:hypothetical protein
VTASFRGDSRPPDGRKSPRSVWCRLVWRLSVCSVSKVATEGRWRVCVAIPGRGQGRTSCSRPAVLTPGDCWVLHAVVSHDRVAAGLCGVFRFGGGRKSPRSVGCRLVWRFFVCSVSKVATEGRWRVCVAIPGRGQGRTSCWRRAVLSRGDWWVIRRGLCGDGLCNDFRLAPRRKSPRMVGAAFVWRFPVRWRSQVATVCGVSACVAIFCSLRAESRHEWLVPRLCGGFLVAPCRKSPQRVGARVCVAVFCSLCAVSRHGGLVARLCGDFRWWPGSHLVAAGGRSGHRVSCWTLRAVSRHGGSVAGLCGVFRFGGGCKSPRSVGCRLGWRFSVRFAL